MSDQGNTVMCDAQLMMQTMLPMQYIMVKIQERIQGLAEVLFQPPDYISNP